MKKFFMIAVLMLLGFTACSNKPTVPDEYLEQMSALQKAFEEGDEFSNGVKNYQHALDSYRECREQLKKGPKPKVETVRVLRAASSYVMNNPAFYNRNIKYNGVDNVITENGKGADDKDIYMLYLSDGTIIKASPRDKPQWLGVQVGEKVRKVTSLKIQEEGDYTYKVVTVVDYNPLYE